MLKFVLKANVLLTGNNDDLLKEIMEMWVIGLVVNNGSGSLLFEILGTLVKENILWFC